uniref:Uncharacterized protein n=1 Tax=Arundo donax TaxID=35708 RepID=A0A0A9HLA2_ARUDO
MGKNLQVFKICLESLCCFESITSLKFCPARNNI